LPTRGREEILSNGRLLIEVSQCPVRVAEVPQE
jgi:hypothetical protein